MNSWCFLSLKKSQEKKKGKLFYIYLTVTNNGLIALDYLRGNTSRTETKLFPGSSIVLPLKLCSV